MDKVDVPWRTDPDTSLGLHMHPYALPGVPSRKCAHTQVSNIYTDVRTPQIKAIIACHCANPITG